MAEVVLEPPICRMIELGDVKVRANRHLGEVKTGSLMKISDPPGAADAGLGERLPPFRARGS
jgi:hypothetical protein